MKTGIYILFSVLIFSSCQKELTNDPIDSSGSCKIARMSQGVNNTDSVFLIQYDNLNRIQYILDSVHSDTIKPEYDLTDTNRVRSIDDAGGFQVNFYYDDGGSLSTVGTSYREELQFQYNAEGLPIRKDQYVFSDLYRYYTYEFNEDNDLVSLKEYSPSGELQNETIFDYYTNIDNNLKELCLYNFFNALGSNDILSPDFYYNRHMIKSYTKTGLNGNFTSVNYLLDSNGNIAKSETTVTAFNHFFTRYFSYSCN